MTTYRHSPLADDAPEHSEVVTEWSGQTMGGRVPAFLGLAQGTGGVFFEKPPTVEAGLREVGMDFTVELNELHTSVLDNDGVTQLDLPRHRATTGRWTDGRIEAFGPVGTRYQPIQNTDAAELGQLLVDGGDAALLAIGTYGQPFGCHTYMAFDLGGFEIGGQDKHKTALSIVNHHDGSGGLVVQAAPVRVACTNQVAGIFGRRRKSRYVVRHTSSAKGKVAEIRNALGMVAEYVETYEREAELLLSRDMSTHAFERWERELFEGDRSQEDMSQRERTLSDHRNEALVQIWNGGTNEFGRHTEFAAAQSVIEYLDHEAIVRGRDPERARMERILAGTTETTKARAWESLV